MMHYFFCIGVALLTFVIGVGWNYSFRLLTNVETKAEVVTSVEYVSVPESPMTSFRPAGAEGTARIRNPPKCRDSLAIAVWNNVREDQGNDLAGFMNAVGITDCSKVISIEKRVDLNGDGVRETIVRSGGYWWNGANNYPIWIFTKSKTGYKLIFQESVFEYKITKSLTNGYRDIFVKHHMGYGSSFDSNYRYSSGRYRERNCLYIDYGTAGKRTVTPCSVYLKDTSR